jgi:hypothetical protein
MKRSKAVEDETSRDRVSTTGTTVRALCVNAPRTGEQRQ